MTVKGEDHIMWVEHAAMTRALKTIHLFSFDDYAFPFQRGVRLRMNSYPTHADARPEPVVRVGEPGSVDAGNIAYYGTVLRVGDEYWMYYLGNDDSPEWYQRICLAKSKDGINWFKPELGVYEHRGSTKNNVCDFPLGAHIQACVVFYDPEDPDPARRFKLSFESPKYDKCHGVAFSPDGIHWKEYEHNPVGTVFFEQAGGVKHNGVFYLTGQGATGHYSPKGSRALNVYCSRDFIHWTPCSCQGFTREALPPKATVYGGANGPQVHLGAGLWDRGNVTLGVYGMWNGHPSNDRNLICMHLGLVITHDLLHYTEPVPDFPLILAGEQKNNTPAHNNFPALMQGQGFANEGDQTLIWYGLWPECDSNGVRVAMWPRDRIGSLSPFVRVGQEAFVISDVIHLENQGVRLSLNIGGLNEYSKVQVSVLDEDFQPLPGYGADKCTSICENGFHVPVAWGNKLVINAERPIRIRIDFGGIRPEDVALYAAYLEE